MTPHVLELLRREQEEVLALQQLLARALVHLDPGMETLRRDIREALARATDEATVVHTTTDREGVAND